EPIKESMLLNINVSTEVPPSCSTGCEHCSEYNGCLKCRPRLFILLERNDIRQIGICLAACPVGYYGIRNRDMNKCTQCKIENCEACFSRNFCTKCKEGLYSHRGRCFSSCPEGFTINGTMECVGENKKNPQNRGEKNGKNRGQDSKESGKGGNKKKKTPNQSTTVPTITTSMVT
ncbi:hypothetical protein cypCar_00013704, partial [Cyprinus carpio]